MDANYPTMLNSKAMSQNIIERNSVIYLVEENFNPSTDYFVLPAVSSLGHEVIRCSFKDLPSPMEMVGAIVVFVRYIPRSWAKLIENSRGSISRLIFFMDDDVLDINSTKGLSLKYRFKLARFSVARKDWLKKYGAELWVSTTYLQHKYSDWQPSLILPSPTRSSSAVKSIRRVFYHGGSTTHQADIKWLRPIIEEVLERSENLVFEIVGGSRVNRYYRRLPRVNVIHPMNWSSYQAFLMKQGRHIGLAPQLDTPFNSARSYTKFFEITHSEAVGIFSKNSAFADVVTHGVDGFVLEMSPKEWVETILKIADDEPLRRKMIENANRKLGQLSEHASRSYSGLGLS